MKEIPKIFNAYSRYYDLLYQDKDYKGESEFGTLIIKTSDSSENYKP